MEDMRENIIILEFKFYQKMKNLLNVYFIQ